MSKPRVWVCDIDGTLAERGSRNPYDESRVYEDTPLPTCRVVETLFAMGDKVIFFSGRSEGCRKDSEAWLLKHLGDWGELKLYMRATRDMRKDAVVKKEMYDKHIKDQYEVLGVFDDRLQVCRMWYDLGLFVLNCNQGLKEF